MKTTARARPPAGLDISPLIDMVFILLIFFMVSTTFVKDAQVDLTRPSAKSATNASTKALRVSIDRQGIRRRIVRRSRKKHALSVLSGIIGTGLLVVAIAILTRPSRGPKELSDDQETKLELMKAPPKKKPTVAKRAPKPQTKARARAPRPSLATDLSNLGSGLALFDTGDLPNLTDTFLKDGDARKDVVMTREAVDELPTPLPGNPPIVAPDDAQRRGIDGLVVVRLLIDKEGRVLEAKIAQANPEGIFEDVVLETIRNWRFHPATYRGQPVLFRMEQPIRFRIG